MDVLNFISWLKSKRQVTTVNASQTLIPLGLKDARRGDSYLPGAISVEDLASAIAPSLYDADRNTFVGKDAFNSIVNPENTDNVAIGYNVLKNNIGARSVGVGSNTLVNNTTGFQNIAIGANTLSINTTGENNVALSPSALYFNTTGKNNIAIGTLTMLFNTTGSFNTSIGLSVSPWSTTASSNTALGAEIDYGNFNSCVLLGRQAQPSDNNQFVVGSSSYNAGTIATEALTPTKSWAIRINGVNYKIPLQIA